MLIFQTISVTIYVFSKSFNVNNDGDDLEQLYTRSATFCIEVVK